MGTGGGLFNEGQTYGNGEVNLKGGFTEPVTTPVVVHGKGWQVARTATTGCYLITLQPLANSTLAWKAMLTASATTVAPASTGVTTLTHPGFVVFSELLANGYQCYMYNYSFAGSQQWLASAGAGTIIEFDLVMSISSLNT
jgi:hypothetical protein